MELVSQIGGGVTNGLAYLGSLFMLAGRAAWYTSLRRFAASRCGWAARFRRRWMSEYVRCRFFR